jgi:hypothetical protein
MYVSSLSHKVYRNLNNCICAKNRNQIQKSATIFQFEKNSSRKIGKASATSLIIIFRWKISASQVELSLYLYCFRQMYFRFAIAVLRVQPEVDVWRHC